MRDVGALTAQAMMLTYARGTNGRSTASRMPETEEVLIDSRRRCWPKSPKHPLLCIF